MKFKNRTTAGLKLAEKLANLSRENAVIIGLTKGGVVVAKAISDKLNVPFMPLVVNKIRAPFNPELAIGAVCGDRAVYIDWKLALSSGADEAYINSQIADIQATQKQIQQKYYQLLPGIPLVNRQAVITDDGIATGATIRAALIWAESKKAKNISVAAPVAPADTVNMLKKNAEVFILEQPDSFGAVGEFYEDFKQLTQEDIMTLLGTPSKKL